MDRNTVAAVYHDLTSALFGEDVHPTVIGRTVGLGGRDVTYYDIQYMVEEGFQALDPGNLVPEQSWHFDVIEDEAMLRRALGAG